MQVRTTLAERFTDALLRCLLPEDPALPPSPSSLVRVRVPERPGSSDLLVAADRGQDTTAARAGLRVLGALLERAGGVEKVRTSEGLLQVSLSAAKLYELAEYSLRALTTSDDEAGHEWMVYYGNPNLNKPLHVGHLRSICLGECVCRLIERLGARAVRGSIVSDCGLHVAKTVVAGRLALLDPSELPSKADHAAGALYLAWEREAARRAAAGDEVSLLAETEELTLRWQRGDVEARHAFRAIARGVAEGHERTTDALGVRFDRLFLESEAFDRVERMVEQGLELGIFYRREDGAVMADLGAIDKQDYMVVRANGIPNHLGIIAAHNAVVADEYRLHGSIGLEGNEFGDFLEVLVHIVERLGYQKRDGSVLMNYGMVTDQEGDVSSSREGAPRVDHVLERLEGELASSLPHAHPRWQGAGRPPALRALAVANLKYALLARDAYKNMEFRWPELVAVAASSGISILRCLARLEALAGHEPGAVRAGVAATPAERALLAELLRLPLVLHKATAAMAPHAVARGTYELARTADGLLRQADGRELGPLTRPVAALARDGLAIGLDVLGIDGPAAIERAPWQP